jgi:hypothetical protein
VINTVREKKVKTQITDGRFTLKPGKYRVMAE